MNMAVKSDARISDWPIIHGKQGINELVAPLFCPSCMKATRTSIIDGKTRCFECGRIDNAPNYADFVKRETRRLFGLGKASISSNGGNWCTLHDHVIDAELVLDMKPECISKVNGCANCPHSVYRRTIEVKIFGESEKLSQKANGGAALMRDEYVKDRLCPECSSRLKLSRRAGVVYCSSMSCKFVEEGFKEFVPASELLDDTSRFAVTGRGSGDSGAVADFAGRPVSASAPVSVIIKNKTGGSEMEKTEIKDISEVVPRAIECEGEQAAVEELVGKVIVVEKFGFLPSKYQEGQQYATVQVQLDNGNKAWFNTGSGPILDSLAQIKDKLPVRCKIEKRKASKSGMRYFVLASAKTVA